MFPKLFFAFTLSVNVLFCSGQDAPLLSKGKKPNIEIITFDGAQVSGRIADITLDYILLDAKRFNSPAVLSIYYIRPEGKYYKISIEYIRAAIVTSKKKVGPSAIGSAASGALIASTVAQNGNTGEQAAAAAVGLGIGSVVGTIKALSRHQKAIPVLGSSERLMELVAYYE